MRWRRPLHVLTDDTDLRRCHAREESHRAGGKGREPGRLCGLGSHALVESAWVVFHLTPRAVGNAGREGLHGGGVAGEGGEGADVACEIVDGFGGLRGGVLFSWEGMEKGEGKGEGKVLT